MKKNRLITVQDIPVSVCQQDGKDYISITDMLKAKDGDFFISDWLRNRNTIEFLGIWESLNNPDFNYGEYAIIRSLSGLNSYKISVKEWVEKTNAKGLCAKTGRYGGTYAHEDIALEFGTWISPAFKLYLIKEYKRLKEQESKTLNSEWNLRRSLAATNYRIHTDAIKQNIIIWGSVQQNREAIIYAEEADLINLALFGVTAKQWREIYPEETSECRNLRDCADTHRLIVLSNLESTNAILIQQNFDKEQRFAMLRRAAVTQLESLNKLSIDPETLVSPNKKRVIEKTKIEVPPEVLALREAKELQMDFGDAIAKIANAGKPK